jgi:hypothetical protein
VPLGPLGLDQPVEDEAGRHQVGHVVAERAVVLGVQHAPGLGDLHVRTPIEVRPDGGEAGLARVVREGPAHGVRHREHPSPAGTQHPRDLAMDAVGIRHERDRAVGGERDVEARVRERQHARVGDDEGSAHAGGLVVREARVQHALRDVGRDHVDPTPGEPARALRRPRADLQHLCAREVTEEACIRLAQTLGAPHEVCGAQEGAVLVEVLDGVRVPPVATRVGRRPVVDGVVADGLGGLRLGCGGGHGASLTDDPGPKTYARPTLLARLAVRQPDDGRRTPHCL